MPAFFEPLRATVPTGTPSGICRIERIESHPSIEFLDLMGTPITGRVVIEAIIPGRCAAPPAPAIITLIPLFLAFCAYLNIFSGVLCADTISTSEFIPNSFRISIAFCMTGRSLLLPIIIPTSSILFCSYFYYFFYFLRYFNCVIYIFICNCYMSHFSI